MRIYKVTSTKDGEPWCFNMERMPEVSFNIMKKFFAKYGEELHGEVIAVESDRPVYRHATDEERAAGQPRLILNR